MGNEPRKSRYHQWVLTLTDHRSEANTLGAWVATTLVFVTIIVVCSTVSPLVDWFRLPLWPALAAFLPSVVFGVTCSIIEGRGHLSLGRFAVLQFIGSSLLTCFFACLVALSSQPGSFVLASLLILTVAYHGYILRTSSKYPYVAGGWLLAIGAAVFLNPTRETATLLAFVGATAVMLGLFTGAMGLREHVHRGEREKLRQAIYYRALNDSSREYERVSRKVVQLLGHNHDAGNLLSTVFLSAQLLDENLKEVTVEGAVQSRVATNLERLTTQLDNLKGLIQRAQSLSEDAVELKPAPVEEVIAEVIRDYRALYPSTSIEMRSVAPSAVVRVHDGRIGLRRILDNVVQNACEGNGTAAASKIVVEVEPGEENIRVSCQDDGPGFKPDQLAMPPIPFRTTKADGHGLGLFNVSHLVSASGGRFSMKNGQDRGAVVEIELVTA